jgi:hypothetical protein
MVHVGVLRTLYGCRLKDFMEANSRKSGLLMLFMVIEMVRHVCVHLRARGVWLRACVRACTKVACLCVRDHALDRSACVRLSAARLLEHGLAWAV